MNVSWAIGLSGGGLLGGWIYKHFGEKANFAMKYLAEQGITGISPSQAFEKVMTITGKSNIELTNYFWDLHHPNIIWLPFLVLSTWSVIGMLYYSKKY